MIVTGASGFIGSHLVRRLLSEGAEVHAVSREPRTDGVGAGRAWQCDLGDATAIHTLVGSLKPEVIFHLASQVSGQRDAHLVVPIFVGNLQSSVNLLRAAAAHGAPRVVLAGSMEEPGVGDDSPVPSSPYAASKWATTAYARMYHALWELPTVVLRIAMVYGPQQRDDRKLIPYVITSLLAGQAPHLGSGNREIDWVYVDDVVEAFVAAALVAAAPGGVFDIGSGVPMRIRDTVEMLRGITGSTVGVHFGAVADRRFDASRIASTQASTDVLGWRSRVALEDGLARTVDWYARHSTSEVSSSSGDGPVVGGQQRIPGVGP
ncbi:NAD-dependent epimerase/dehydratase family protein [Pseudonocardia sp. 73-21]|uniref:NAD-dependent epimerase/dehydratase family protein n=1 Tax=Pseudonocardia sp. 73-21 TaxID=1895809 RepID=UPI002614D2C6|nr:NAD-dependent epimerase/dehydratase family protein [Pseudonocardia sp. 73-21]